MLAPLSSEYPPANRVDSTFVDRMTVPLRSFVFEVFAAFNFEVSKSAAPFSPQITGEQIVHPGSWHKACHGTQS